MLKFSIKFMNNHRIFPYTFSDTPSIYIQFIVRQIRELQGRPAPTCGHTVARHASPPPASRRLARPAATPRPAPPRCGPDINRHRLMRRAGRGGVPPGHRAGWGAASSRAGGAREHTASQRRQNWVRHQLSFPGIRFKRRRSLLARVGPGCALAGPIKTGEGVGTAAARQQHGASVPPLAVARPET